MNIKLRLLTAVILGVILFFILSTLWYMFSGVIFLLVLSEPTTSDKLIVIVPPLIGSLLFSFIAGGPSHKDRFVAVILTFALLFILFVLSGPPFYLNI